MHRELQAALRSALSYGSITQGGLVDVHPSTAWAMGQGGGQEG